MDPKLRNREALGQLCRRQREQFIQIEAGRPEDSKRDASELKGGKKEGQLDYLVYLTALEV